MEALISSMTASGLSAKRPPHILLLMSRPLEEHGPWHHRGFAADDRPAAPFARQRAPAPVGGRGCAAGGRRRARGGGIRDRERHAQSGSGGLPPRRPAG